MSEQSLAIRQAIGVERLGEIMWKSGYWQDTRSQAQAIVKILAGAELDIGPIASMNGIYVIEGRTSLSATLLGATIQRSERYRYRIVEHDDTHCVIDFFEISGGKREKVGTSSFSLEDAKNAQLLGKRGQMWEKYPRNMVFSRALSNGARWYTPDIFSGPVYTPDELGAEVDIDGNAMDVAPYTPTREQDVVDVAPSKRMVTDEDDRVWKRWLEVRSDALKYGIVPPGLSLPIAYQQLVSNATMLKAQVEDKQEQLDKEEAARKAARAEAETDFGDVWESNRALMAEAYAAGIKIPDLPNTATREEVLERNKQLAEQLVRG